MKQNIFFRIFYKFRFLKLKRKFKSCGKNIDFYPPYVFTNPSSLTFGDDVFIGPYSYIAGTVTFSNKVMCGPGVSFFSGDHLFGRVGQYNRFLKPNDNENIKPIFIGEDCWIGANTTVLKGVEIGMGCVVGAGSVITSSLPPFTVCAGNPCKPLKYIFSNEDLIKHLRILNYDCKFIDNIIDSRNRIYSHQVS